MTADSTPDLTAAPIVTRPQTVLPDWIDFNGHMNVAYYTLAFDRALDEVLSALDIGEAAAQSRRMGPMALQTQIHYLGELHEGERFRCDFQLLDTDHKRTHFFMTMRAQTGGTLAATYESLSINVDLETRRSAPYPQEAQTRLAALLERHRDLPRPDLVGAPIRIRR